MTSLEKDYAVLVQMCKDDKSGALKEYFGDGDDPSEWEGVEVEDGRVTGREPVRTSMFNL